jgi:aminodeoxyfutalosine synthase
MQADSKNTSAQQQSAVKAAADKVRAGERLNADDALLLYEHADLHLLGELAHTVRTRLHGNTTYYNINEHIHYTNYCILHCRFCSFCRPYSSGAADGYELSVDEMVERAAKAAARGATEVHIVGGLHPKLPFEYYVDLCQGIRSACPRLHIKAFTAIEIVHLARISRPTRTIRQVLETLRDAGLGSLPGGGAEIFDERVHAEVFQHKVGQAGWFDVHRAAHEMGMFTNATMLYGHVETPAERIGHLITLREHQDRSLTECSAHFNCMVPLSFIPAGSELAHLPAPTGKNDLRTLAITRLVLDNVAHLKAFWVMQTAKLAQVSLNWGVDDLDGTVIQYDITPSGKDTRSAEMTVDQIHRLIRETGGSPVERDTLYRSVQRSGTQWQIADELS